MTYPKSGTQSVYEGYDKSHGLTAQFRKYFENITASDVAFLDPPIRSLYVGVAGNVECVCRDAPALASGIAQDGGTSTQIILAADTAQDDNYFNGHVVAIVAGTGSGQVRYIDDYTGTTDLCTVSVAWTTNPDHTSKYLIRRVGIAALGVGYHPVELEYDLRDTYNSDRPCRRHLNA